MFILHSVYQQLIQRGVNSYTQLSNGDGEGFLSSLVEQEVSSATIAFSQVQLALEVFILFLVHSPSRTEEPPAINVNLLNLDKLWLSAPTRLQKVLWQKSPARATKSSAVLAWETGKSSFVVVPYYRRYMTKLSTCLKQKNWLCPHCRNICNCGSCLRFYDV